MCIIRDLVLQFKHREIFAPLSVVRFKSLELENIVQALVWIKPMQVKIKMCTALSRPSCLKCLSKYKKAYILATKRAIIFSMSILLSQFSLKSLELENRYHTPSWESSLSYVGWMKMGAALIQFVRMPQSGEGYISEDTACLFHS